jgi:hypothetical protein
MWAQGASFAPWVYRPNLKTYNILRRWVATGTPLALLNGR